MTTTEHFDHFFTKQQQNIAEVTLQFQFKEGKCRFFQKKKKGKKIFILVKLVKEAVEN